MKLCICDRCEKPQAYPTEITLRWARVDQGPIQHVDLCDTCLSILKDQVKSFLEPLPRRPGLIS